MTINTVDGSIGAQLAEAQIQREPKCIKPWVC